MATAERVLQIWILTVVDFRGQVDPAGTQAENENHATCEKVTQLSLERRQKCD